MPVKVLVVDDSALMRKHVRQILEEDSRFIVSTARDGQDALNQIPKLDPAVITLDINMPVMDGLTCLSRIMTEFPRPVVMLSSLTEKGALASFEAIELGAVDYVAKPGGTVSLNIRDVAQTIREKVHAAAGSRIRRAAGLRDRLRAQRVPPRAEVPVARGSCAGLVVIGVSTGGPSTLEGILTELPSDFPWPIVVAQHMPSRFTRVFAQRLDGICAVRVCEVDGPTELRAGSVFVARGDADMVIGKRRNQLVALNTPQDTSLWHPSVDRLMQSAMEHFAPQQLIGVQLTGMGYDGADAMKELHRRGGRTIAESEDSAVVFGMPKELIERGGASVVLAADDVAKKLQQWLS